MGEHPPLGGRACDPRGMKQMPQKIGIVVLLPWATPAAAAGVVGGGWAGATVAAANHHHRVAFVVLERFHHSVWPHPCPCRPPRRLAQLPSVGVSLGGAWVAVVFKACEGEGWQGVPYEHRSEVVASC